MVVPGNADSTVILWRGHIFALGILVQWADFFLTPCIGQDTPYNLALNMGLVLIVASMLGVMETYSVACQIPGC